MKSTRLLYGMLQIFVGFAVIACIIVAGCVNDDNSLQLTERINLVSLERQTTIDGYIGGGAFIFSGYIESVPSYFYYIQLPSGGYKLETIPASDCVIFMDENESPYLVAHYGYGYLSRSGGEEYGETGSQRIVRRYGSNTVTVDYMNGSYQQYVRYERIGDVELHIPANSIVKEYKP
jgi:hypothetical protein